MSKNVTIRDVAKRAGTSVATVSYALNGRTGMVSDEMSRRVHRVARTMGYRPSRQARHLRGRSTMTLAMQLDFGVSFSNTWRSTLALTLMILNGASAYAASRGYQVNLLISERGQAMEDLQQQILDENAVDGVMFMGYRKLEAEGADELIRRLRLRGVAAVTVDETLGTAGLPVVAVNLKPAVEQAVERLRELGCRRVAYIGLMHQIVHERVARFDLFREALERSGIELPEKNVIRTVREVDGYRHTLDLLQRGPLPDCIIYGADHVAMAGLEALRDQGVKVPDEVRVLGVDHAPYAAEAPVQLASLDQRYFDRGQTLAKVLIDQLQNSKSSVRSRTELDAIFVDGESLSGSAAGSNCLAHSERSLETC